MRADRKRRRRGRQIRAVYQIAVIVLLLMCYGKLDLVQGMAVDGLNQAMETRKDVMAIECTKEADKSPKTSLGTFKISHYCNEKYPHICNAGPPYLTASGTVATVGRTIGVDTEIIPYGSVVEINGQAYIAEDTGGGIKGNEIDMLVESHAEALEKGVYETKVFMIEEE